MRHEKQRNISLYMRATDWRLFLDNHAFCKVYFKLDRSDMYRKLSKKFADPAFLLSAGLITEKEYMDYHDLKKRDKLKPKYLEEKRKIQARISAELYKDI